jgi:hypothetical protein
MRRMTARGMRMLHRFTIHSPDSVRVNSTSPPTPARRSSSGIGSYVNSTDCSSAFVRSIQIVPRISTTSSGTLVGRKCDTDGGCTSTGAFDHLKAVAAANASGQQHLRIRAAVDDAVLPKTTT